MPSQNLVLRGSVDKVDRYGFIFKKSVLVIALDQESHDLLISQVGPRIGTFDIPPKIGVKSEWFRERDCQMTDFPVGSSVEVEAELGTEVTEYFFAQPIFAVATMKVA